MNSDYKKRIDSAYKLLSGTSTTVEKFESVRVLIKGVNPKIDVLLTECSKHLTTIGKIQANQIVELTAENLPEQTEKDKKRKKAILLFIKSFKDLKSEVERVRTEFQNSNQQGKINTASRIGLSAKGVFGLLTIAAVVIVGFITLQGKGQNANQAKQSPAPTDIAPSKTTIKAIEFNGKKIALTELMVGHGPDCDSPHYHALDDISAIALDSSVVKDPGGCGFGRVKEVSIIETN